MWKEGQSDAARTLTIMAHNDLTGDALFRKFRTASREPIRLAAALRGALFVEEVSPEQAQAYQSCLHTRLRPAVQTLIEIDAAGQLAALASREPFTAGMTDDFLTCAVKMGREEILLWLLHYKQDRFGFPDRDLSL